MAETLAAKWLIWRLDISGDMEKALRAGLERYREKFGVQANRATVSVKAAPALVEKVQALVGPAATSGYIFNPNEVFVGYEAETTNNPNSTNRAEEDGDGKTGDL